MKSFCLLFGLLILTAQAADLTTKSGVVYRDVKILKPNAKGLKILHKYGGKTIPYPDLPDELREKYRDEENRLKELAAKRKKEREEREKREAEWKKEREKLAEKKRKEELNRNASEILHDRLIQLLKLRKDGVFTSATPSAVKRYKEWQNSMNKTMTEIRETKEINSGIRVAAADIFMLGIHYATNNGEETNASWKILRNAKKTFGIPIDPDEPDTLYDEKHHKSNGEAWVFCQELVKSKLKAPRTAKFRFWAYDDIKKRSDGVFVINSYVDSQNSFGAMVRTKFHCELAVRGDQFLVRKLVFYE